MCVSVFARLSMLTSKAHDSHDDQRTKVINNSDKVKKKKI